MLLFLQYYNAPAEAIGYYLRLKDDDMRVKMEYFDFVGFQVSESDNDLKIMSKSNHFGLYCILPVLKFPVPTYFP